uniref:MARVEL domain-containing protein n=1 Tax=Salarias fasciatus TaxID=181472 RepID=A0A672G6L3_SALFA
MSGNQDERPAVEMDTSFLRSRRGIVKLAEMGTLFVAFVCFAVACLPQHIAATVLEFFITLFLLLLYLLRLNKRLTLFFWPLVVSHIPRHKLTKLHKVVQELRMRKCCNFQLFFFSRVCLFVSPKDLFNSTFAAVYLIVLGLIALTTYTVTGVLVGGVRSVSFIWSCDVRLFGPALIYGTYFPTCTPHWTA